MSVPILPAESEEPGLVVYGVIVHDALARVFT